MTSWHPQDTPGRHTRPAPARDDPGAAGEAGTGTGYLPGPGFAGPGAETAPWPALPGPGLTGQDAAYGGEDQQYWPDGPGAETAPWPALDGPGGHPGHRRGRRRLPLLLPALAAIVVIAAAAAILTGRPHARPAAPAAAARPAASGTPARPAAAAPAITSAAAQQLLARYVAANNTANQVRSDTRLARIEGGSSYQLDAGGYQFLTASDPGNTSYQSFTYTPSAWYIPRLASWPRWFAVYGTWAGTRSAPYHGYLVFAQASPAARWLQVLAPNITAGAAGPAAVPATGPGGYATAVPAPPGLPAATAAALDGTAAAAAVTGLPALADQQDRAYWEARVPRGTAVTDRHSPAPDGAYALAARGGGAVVFYSLAASLAITPPAGEPVQLQIPGYYSAGTPVTRAAVPYADQFAAWTGPGGTRVIAQNSGIAARR